MEFTFTNGDYKTEFREYVDELFNTALAKPREQRMELSDKLINTYVRTTGKVPDGVQLDRLSTLILRDELASKQKNKVQKMEYNFHSEWQEEKRKREEVDGRLASNYGTDGKKHGKGKRNRKTGNID